MKAYAYYMGLSGKGEGIKFEFEGGSISNTLHEHRILYWLQNTKGPDAATKAALSLYSQYFEHRADPAGRETLEKVCIAAGLGEDEVKKVVGNQEEGLREVKAAIREQAGNGVDSVPYVVFEGKKRDFTHIGAKSVKEYVKVLVQVEKECA